MTDGGTKAPSSVPAGVGPRRRYARDRLGGAQKSAAGVPAYLRFVNRRMGGSLAALGFGFGLTPNHLTAISAAWSMAAILTLCLVSPTVPVAVAIAVALLIGYAFDSADGQLSRIRGDGKPSGEWLDHVVDMAKTASLHGAVVVSLFRFGGLDHAGWLLIPLAFGIVNVTFFFAMLLRDQLGGRPARVVGPGGGASAVRSLALLPMDYGTLCMVFVLLAWPVAFLLAYGALGAFAVVFSARGFVRAYRNLAAVQ